MSAEKTRKGRKAVPAGGNDADPRAILERIQREQLVAVERGKRKRMSAREMLVRRVWAAAMKGNVGAIRRIVKWGEFLELPRSNHIPIKIVPNGYHNRKSKP
jgi:hypothetical protein